MDADKRKQMTTDLSTLSEQIAEDLLGKIRSDGPTRAVAEALHRDERVGDSFDVWADLLSRRAAVLWVLKSVYVRVLEDRGLLSPHRILDEQSQKLFEALAPNLAESAYLRWIYTDLASPQGGLPELFAPQPAEVTLPDDKLSRRLIEFWRRRNVDTGVLAWSFTEEHFDGRLMGDLYQDLDPVVKDRYALFQTPAFIVDFILDETLTPAIAEFGVEVVRVLDPACGSGHFLLAAFKRLVQGMRAKYPNKPITTVVRDVLARVVGIDLNDYACALARARLVMTGLEACGDTTLVAGATFHPQVYWADGLEQIETEAQLGIAECDVAAMVRASLTRPEASSALRPALADRFHVVVGNPPFDAEKDPRRRDYHRERTRAGRRYASATGKYSLCAPFIERMFQLCVRTGRVGVVTTNAFTKRQFGKGLVEKVLNIVEIRKVIDASGVPIPGPGVRTLLLFGARQPPQVRPVMIACLRADTRPGQDPANTPTWQAIATNHNSVGFENEHISVTELECDALSKHPWSISSAAALACKARIRTAGPLLRELADSIGIMSFTLEDDAYVRSQATWRRIRVSESATRISLSGDEVRNWRASPRFGVLFPYDSNLEPIDPDSLCLRSLWPFRSRLEQNLLFGGETKKKAGLRWYEYGRLTKHKVNAPFLITYPEVATHGHFVVLDGGAILRQTCHMIAPRADAERSHWNALAAFLNSSVCCFWLKQVCHSHGEGGGTRARAGNAVMGSEPWKNHYSFDATAVGSVPVASVTDPRLEELGESIVALSRATTSDSLNSILSECPANPRALRKLLEARRARDTERHSRMVVLQEEIDWLCYRLYGIDPDAPRDEIRSPKQITPYCPGLRPFEITLAGEDQEHRDSKARGEELDDAPTDWFERHGWMPTFTLDELPNSERTIVEARLARTAASRSLALIEQPTYKRRWYRPDYEADEKEALETWLCDRIEDWARSRPRAFTAAQAAAALQDDPAVLAVCEVLTKTRSFDLHALVAERIRCDAVPNVKTHVFKPSGLDKRAAWEQTWDLQHQEDEGKKVTPPVPPDLIPADRSDPTLAPVPATDPAGPEMVAGFRGARALPVAAAAVS
jgi:SAM-dependent methyltransferase